MAQSELSTLELSYKYGTSPLPALGRASELKTYLFGHPISHSRAPGLQNGLFRDMGVAWTYSLFESVDTAAFVERLRAPDCIGSAVTMPHKVKFMAEVDDVTEEGRAIGAINTVFVRLDAAGRRRYIGTNTDCIGVRESFLQNFPGVVEAAAGRPGLIIGAGGAARSAIYALWKWLGVRRILVVNRYKHEVDVLVADFAKLDGLELVYVGSVAEAAAAAAPALVVGTVPFVVPVEPGEVLANEIVAAFMAKPEKGFVLEMCYHPVLETAFYKLAKAEGWPVLYGTEALIYQGIAQQVLWTETPLEAFPVAKTVAEFNAALTAEEHA
ncbi:Aminoacid dehydrogenase-like protein [Dipodascopsis tothii]|uniref:Aminoacid dehydrogenase-like protein n=1 Tax=Dipodascopsis tothii TaxID=44089 RepID=UPI0034CDAA19